MIEQQTIQPAAETATDSLSEAQVIAMFDLPDEHCERCHHRQGTMSMVMVEDRLIEVCCFVAENYNRLASKN